MPKPGSIDSTKRAAFMASARHRAPLYRTITMTGNRDQRLKQRFVQYLVVLLVVLAPIRALAWSQDPATPDGWAWTQIKAGVVADFNDHCHANLDPHDRKGWDDPCRRLDPQFLVDVLTVPKFQAQVAGKGVRLHGADIAGNVDLSDAEIAPEVWLDGSRIEGFLNLSDAHLKHLLSLDGSLLTGQFLAYRMTADSNVTMQDHAYFLGDVQLDGAKIGGGSVHQLHLFHGTRCRRSRRPWQPVHEGSCVLRWRCELKRRIG